MAVFSSRDTDLEFEDIRIKSNSFGDVKLEESLLDDLMLTSPLSCYMLEFSNSPIALCDNPNKDLFLEKVAQFCSTATCLAELNLHGARASAMQLEAIFEALLFNEVDSLQNMVLNDNPVLHANEDLG